MRASGGLTALPPAQVERKVQDFIRKFEPKHQALIRAARKILRMRLRLANELAYDNYNFFVIGYSSTERPTDSIVSLAAGANGVSLAFPYCGTKLPDPHQLLLGSGSKNRFIRLPSAETLNRPEVQALITAAVACARTPLPARGQSKLIIRSVSQKQRPRRKPPK